VRVARRLLHPHLPCHGQGVPVRVDRPLVPGRGRAREGRWRARSPIHDLRNAQFRNPGRQPARALLEKAERVCLVAFTAGKGPEAEVIRPPERAWSQTSAAVHAHSGTEQQPGRSAKKPRAFIRSQASPR
jgi:hypothetical protein